METKSLKKGDIITAWCRFHGPMSQRRYEPDGKCKLVCLECEKEQASKKEIKPNAT